LRMGILVLGLALLGIFAGTLAAISGATVGSVVQNRWNGSLTAGSVTTQGGNISQVQLSSTQLTTKWTSFSGNVTGTIRLSDTQAGNVVYLWTYNTAAGGKVCVSTNSSQVFTSPTNTTAAAIDANFSTTGTPDNASATFNTTCGTLSLSTGALTGFLAAQTQGSSNFKTCAATSVSSLVPANYYFCTAINSAGLNYLGSSANYEVIAPANASITYYFYAELS
jgi:hypothetical protein